MAKIVIKKPLKTQMRIVKSGPKVAPRPAMKAIPVPAAPVMQAPAPTPVFVPVPVPAQAAVPPPAPVQQQAVQMASSEAVENARLTEKYLVSVIGADVRGELSRLADAAERLSAGACGEEEREQICRSIRQGSRDTIQLLDDILAASKIGNAGDLALSEVSRLGDLVESAVAPYRQDAESKGVRLTLDAENLPPVSMDPFVVRQLLRNLVSNAARQTSNGRIGVAVSHFNDKLKIVVEDTGCGFTPQQQLSFASSVVGGDEMSDFTGLFFVKRLVLALGGEIDLKSTPGVGTVITICIPGVKAVGGVKNASSMQRLDSSVYRAPLPYVARLLVVDDSPIIRAVTASMLNSLGFNNVSTAGTAQEALVKILTGAVDVVVTDLMMPDMDGRMLVREIRGIPTYANMPVFALTADDTIRDECKAAGFTGVILKPVTKDKLHMALG